jgi:hypothetical protein
MADRGDNKPDHATPNTNKGLPDQATSLRDKGGPVVDMSNAKTRKPKLGRVKLAGQ